MPELVDLDVLDRAPLLVDPRLTLGLVSVFGAFAGAAFMFSTAPDTGISPRANWARCLSRRLRS